MVLGRNEDCFQRGVLVQNVNFMMEEKPADSVCGLQGKLRYAHQEEACRIKKREDDLCLGLLPKSLVLPNCMGFARLFGVPPNCLQMLLKNGCIMLL